MEKTFYIKLEVDLPKTHDGCPLLQDDELCDSFRNFLEDKVLYELNKKPKVIVKMDKEQFHELC